MGHWQFLAVYVVSLVLSNVSTVLKHRDNPDYFCVGASGAVTAVVFSFIIYRPLSQIIVLIIPMPALLYAVLFVAIQLLRREAQSEPDQSRGASVGGALGTRLDAGP